MRLYHLNVPIYMPDRLYLLLRSFVHRLRDRGISTAGVVNNMGERDIEWSWVASQIPAGPGKALDFGNGGSNMSLIAAMAGFEVTAVDLEPLAWTYVHPDIKVLQGDIRSLPLEPHSLDLVINCSTVEHVGLAGRYGVSSYCSDGDIEAMAALRSLMKPESLMVMTIPVGKDTIAAPLHRIYGAKRLPLLLQGFEIKKEQYWNKVSDNRWRLTEKSAALEFVPRCDFRILANNSYGLGCFTLAPKA